MQVQTLTNGNVLFDPQTNKPLGGEGAVMQVPKTGQYADGLLSSGESVEVPFVLCLKTFQPFQFFVNVSGIVTNWSRHREAPSFPRASVQTAGSWRSDSVRCRNVVAGDATCVYGGTIPDLMLKIVFSGDNRSVAYWGARCRRTWTWWLSFRLEMPFDRT